MKRFQRIGIVFVMILFIIGSISFATENVSNLARDTIQNNEEEEAGIPVTTSLEEGNTNMIGENGEMALYDNLEVYENDIYLCEESVSLDKNVDGNVFIMAEKIDIHSVYINGNVFLMGKQINIQDAEILGSVFAFGETIEMSGEITDVYAFGKTIDCKANASILRNLNAFGEKINIEGSVYRNVNLAAEQVNLGEECFIGGIFAYTSEEEANIPVSANIHEIDFTKEVKKDNDDNDFLENFSIYNIVATILKVVVIAGIFLLLSNHLIEANKEITTSNTLKTIGIGLLGFIVIPVVAILLMISIVGSGLSMITILVYIGILYISTVVTSLVIATTILKEKSNSKLMVLGVTTFVYLIIRLLKLVPIIGTCIAIIATLMGIGYMIKTICYKEKKEVLVNHE